jgi:hypothetical protein
VALFSAAIKKVIEKRPCLSLYFGALLATLTYVAALVSTPEGRQIFHAPYGFYGGQYWTNTDAINYVRPAKYFVSHGAFLDHLGGTLTPRHWGVCEPLDQSASDEHRGQRLTPTYHRVIGYSLIIALFMKLFGPYWDLVLSGVNILSFALIYPFLFLIAKLIFPSPWRQSYIIWPFLFLITAGTYVIQVPFYLADMTLTLFLVIGVYFGLKSQLYLRRNDLAGHVLFVGMAALVKSILSYFAFVDVLVLATFSYYRGTSERAKSRWFMAISFVVILAASQFSAMRNFINYNRYMPEDVLSTNLFCYLGKEVAEVAGKPNLYMDGIRELYKIDPGNVSLIDKTKLEKAREIILQHPIITTEVLVKHSLNVLFRSHFHLFGRDLLKEPPSPFMWLVLFPWSYFSSSFLYVGFLCFCFRLAVRRDYMLLGCLLSFIGYLLAPTLLGGGGSRLRTPVEGFLVIFTFAEVYFWTQGSYLFKRKVDPRDLLKNP